MRLHSDFNERAKSLRASANAVTASILIAVAAISAFMALSSYHIESLFKPQSVVAGDDMTTHSYGVIPAGSLLYDTGQGYTLTRTLNGIPYYKSTNYFVLVEPAGQTQQDDYILAYISEGTHKKLNWQNDSAQTTKAMVGVSLSASEHFLAFDDIDFEVMDSATALARDYNSEGIPVYDQTLLRLRDNRWFVALFIVVLCFGFLGLAVWKIVGIFQPIERSNLYKHAEKLEGAGRAEAFIRQFNSEKDEPLYEDKTICVTKNCVITAGGAKTLKISGLIRCEAASGKNGNGKTYHVLFRCEEGTQSVLVGSKARMNKIVSYVNSRIPLAPAP